MFSNDIFRLEFYDIFSLLVTYVEGEKRPRYIRKKKLSKLEEYKPYVNMLLDEAPYSATRIFELIKERGCQLQLSSVTAYVRTIKIEKQKEATVRFETMPGCQGQVDWGFFENYQVFMGQPMKCHVLDYLKKNLIRWKDHIMLKKIILEK